MHQDFFVDSLKSVEHLLNLEKGLEQGCIKLIPVFLYETDKFLNELRQEELVILGRQGDQGMQNIV
jgi:hypothetical protein